VADPPHDGRANETDDVALVCASSSDGETLGVIRKRGELIEAATMRKTSEGQPIHGELVRLIKREEPMLFDVETLYRASTKEARETEGPAQVATDAYRKGWDRLFKKRPRAIN
jgi:hypothetical protein